jgi:class 3 adenylate cyclase
MRTIKIDGEEQPYDCLTEDRKGIKSAGRIFYMFPAARGTGGVSSSIEPLPPIGPREISRVTVEYPDLTADYPETVKDFYQKRQDYHRDVSYEQWCKDCPQDSWMSREDFERGRQKLLSETLEEFAKTNRVKEMVWREHGTEEMAEKIGLLDDYARIILAQWLKDTGKSEDDAWRDLYRIKWVALYDDPPKTRIYLYDLIEEPDPKAAELEFRKRSFETVAKLSDDKRHISGFVEWAGVKRFTLAVVFTDVVDSLPIAEEVGDEAMNEVMRAHFAQSRTLISQHNGYEIKTIGDSFMVAFFSVDKAFDYARALQSNSGHPKIQIRAGIHIGPMTVEEGDVQGKTVGIAARIVSVIKGAEIWLSDRAKEDIDQLGAASYLDLKWERHDGVTLKGLNRTYTLWSLR